VLVAASASLGLALALLDGTGRWQVGWLAYTILIAFGLSLALGVRRLTGAYPASTAALTAFGVRLLAGVVLFLLFPTAGYPDNRVTQAGYTFEDAYVRDRQSLALARSDDPIAVAFSKQYAGDQYGGMMALSAWVYRYLSPDGHRHFLVLVLGAAAAALGVFFTWKAASSWFGEGVAALAAWIFAVYPESVLLGASHMREPFVMMAISVTFYSTSLIWSGRRSWIVWMVVAALSLLLFQPPVALFAFLIVAGAWFFDPHRKTSLREAGMFAALVLVGLIAAGSVLANLPSLAETHPSSIFIAWLQNNFTFQAHQTERASGMFQKVIRDLGEAWKLPVVLLYGSAQPVLPAALGDKPTVPVIWRLVNILRSAGWYTLALFLIYGILSAARGVGIERRRQLLWLSAITGGWILLSAANAGGDMWDNPRYRTIMIAWLALLAAWALWYGRSRKDAWLPRLFLIEAVFVLIFTVWYFSRNYPGYIHLGIWQAVALTGAASLGILAAGIFKDRRSKR
jgi:hypothetical protein